MKKTRNLVTALSILGALAYSGHTAHASELNSVDTKETVRYIQQFANNKSIGFGSNNNKVVRSIQNVLQKLGYNVPITGKFATRTLSAVKDFQSQHGIKPTGAVDSKTAAAMMEDLTVFNKQKAPQPNNTLGTVSYGATNPVVKSIQVVLNSLGYNIPETGYFGVITQSAVKDFQGKHDLKKNGIVDATTANAIMEAALQQKVSPASAKTKSPVVENVTKPTPNLSSKTKSPVVENATKPTPNLSSKTNYYVKVDANKEEVYAYYKTNRTVSYGSTNPVVKNIQVVLNSIGYNIPETGYFGVITQNAVRDFQGKHSLKKNGIVDTTTANAIIKATSQQKSSTAPKTAKQTLNLSSKTNYYVKVDTNKERVHIYHKTNGSWSQIKKLVCSAGAPTSPTIKGIFTTTGLKNTILKIHHKNEDIYVDYFTQIKGNYLFHSVPLDKNGNITDGRLGQAVSAGCVRLSIEDAKYIYNIIPANTTVEII